MKLLMLCAIMFYCIISSETRLILRTTDKPKSEMSSSESVKDISSSRDEIDGPEIIHFYKGKIRTPRQNEDTHMKNITGRTTDTQVKSKTALVKKPIPKYKDVESDEDYQSKHVKTRWPSKLADSVEHEDEDFSLDDYDFDVNHDEFIGRGKPLEPRKEPKRGMEGSKSKSAQKTKRNPITNKATNVDQKDLVKNTSKAVYKMKEDDYDDDFPTTVSSIVSKTNPINRDEDSSDEPESSHEDQVFVRNARSPWTTYVDKLSEKTSTMMAKILSFLPLFPQIPGATKIDGVNSVVTN